jgi:hypothetical protein
MMLNSTGAMVVAEAEPTTRTVTTMTRNIPLAAAGDRIASAEEDSQQQLVSSCFSPLQFEEAPRG